MADFERPEHACDLSELARLIDPDNPLGLARVLCRFLVASGAREPEGCWADMAITGAWFWLKNRGPVSLRALIRSLQHNHAESVADKIQPFGWTLLTADNTLPKAIRMRKSWVQLVTLNEYDRMFQSATKIPVEPGKTGLTCEVKENGEDHVD